MGNNDMSTLTSSLRASFWYGYKPNLSESRRAARCSLDRRGPDDGVTATEVVVPRLGEDDTSGWQPPPPNGSSSSSLSTGETCLIIWVSSSAVVRGADDSWGPVGDGEDI